MNPTVPALFSTTVPVAAIVWFMLAPLAEEPWLEAHYGNAYVRYKERCPRWL